MASAVTTPALDLEKAAKNTKYVFGTAGGKRKYYLTANFEVTQNVKEQAAAPDLVKTVSRAFAASADPRKLEHTSKIFTHLSAMAPASTAPALVKQMLPALEKARLKEIPRQLSMLLQAKDLIKFTCEYIETVFPVIRAKRFHDEHTVTDHMDGEHEYVRLKQPPQPEEVLQFLETTEGLAVAQKYARFSSDEAPAKDFQGTPEDQMFLKRFISGPSGNNYAARLFWNCEAIKAYRAHKPYNARMAALDKSCACMLTYVGTDPSQKNPYYEPTVNKFFEKTFPSFVMLMESYAKDGTKFENDNPERHKHCLKFYEKCKGILAEIGELDAAYRALFEEFHTLSKKYAPADAPAPALPLSPFPALHREEGAPFVFPALPTPDEFAATRCTLTVTDFSPTYPPLPASKPRFAERDRIEDLLLARAYEHDFPSLEESLEHFTYKEPERSDLFSRALSEISIESVRQDRKEDKEPAPVRLDAKEEKPRKVSLFENRTFTFSQKAQRVLDWETAPQRPLAMEPYSSMPAALQKEQTWRHGCSVLDPFVGTSYSRKGEWTNNRGEKQTAYFIQAEVEYGGKTTRCVFQYAFDKDKVLYHRYAGERSNVQIVDDLLAKNRYQNDFPTLDKSFELFKAKPATVKVEIPGEVVYAVDPLEVITVVDEKYGLTIRIFKQG